MKAKSLLFATLALTVAAAHTQGAGVFGAEVLGAGGQDAGAQGARGSGGRGGQAAPAPAPGPGSPAITKAPPSFLVAIEGCRRAAAPAGW